jgi:hypothetical protein
MGLKGQIGPPGMAVARLLNLKGSHVYRTDIIHESHDPERVDVSLYSYSGIIFIK